MNAPDRSPVDAGLWAAMWACGLLFHYVRPGDPWHLEEPVSVVAVAAFALLLTRPRSAPVWVFAALAQIADGLFTAVTRNEIQMSWTIVATLHVALLLSLARSWHLPPDRRAQDALDRLAPAIRGTVLVVYFYAVLHKLNTGYFSSFNEKPLIFVEQMPILSTVVSRLGWEAWSPHIGLATEVAAFALLLFPATRLWGVVTAATMHFGLGWIGFRQFTIMFPLLLLFLQPTTGRLPGPPPGVARFAPWIAVPGLVALLMANEAGHVRFHVFTPPFALVGAMFAAEVLRRVRAHGIVGVGAPPLLHGARDAVLPALFFVWCFVPYFGITTHPCMTMYSHLSVHSGTSNHLFIPAGLQIDAIQGDLVQIIGTSSPRRYPMAAKLPRLALRKSLHVDRLRGEAPKYVIWKEDGREVRANHGVLPDPSWLERLPMISFNGPSALRTAKLQRKFTPRLRQTPTKAIGKPPGPREGP